MTVRHGSSARVAGRLARRGPGAAHRHARSGGGPAPRAGRDRSTSPTTPGRSRRARSSSASAASASTGTTSRPRRSRRARSRSSSSGRSTSTCRSSSSPTRAPRWPVAAAEFFGHPSRELTVAGVTGTNGKTTTTFLLFAILAAAGLRPGLLGTVETRIGGERRPAVRTTPEAIDLQRTLREMLDAGDRSCALEATSHGSELRRLDGTRFAVLVFTNLSQDHLDLHGTMERYFDAKRRLFVEGDPAAGGREHRRPLRPAARGRAARAGPCSARDLRARRRRRT